MSDVKVKKSDSKVSQKDYTPRLKSLYSDVIKDQLHKDLGCANVMQIPRLEKIVISMGLGLAGTDSKVLQSALNEIGSISGQKPVITRARKSIAGFKIRSGMPLGVKVTLRSYKMFEFLDRLINIALPRVRDFRGLNFRSFDGKGNFSLGIQEQVVFPEVDYDKVESIRGMDVNICTTTDNDQHALALLKAFGLPFRKN